MIIHETSIMHPPSRRAAGARKRIFQILSLATLMITVAAAPVAAQDMDARVRRLEEQVDDLRRLLEARENLDLVEIRRQIDAITAEIEILRFGADVVVARESWFGFGPAASKIYSSPHGVSLGGYGETLYENFAGEREDGSQANARDQLDALRVILYVGYKFDDRFLFNSEIEFEHATTGNAGSASVEFGYLDYLFSERAGIRAGLVLLPLGLLNEMHEPTTWLGSERPVTETRIIPSTWRESGIGVFAEFDDIQVRAFLVNGLDAVGDGSSKAAGFSASGIRGGRQKGSKAVAEEFGFAVRAEYTGVSGLVFGASGYIGESGQGVDDPTSPGDELGVRTLIAEGHASYGAHGWDLRALVATADIDDVAALNAARGLVGNESVGERLTGWYVHAGFDVLRSARTPVELIPYVRYESVNTQSEVPAGFAANPANDLEIWTIGAAVRPISHIILKTDYQIRTNEARTGVNQFDVSLGYIV